jgi:hypothetical protein
LAWVYKEPFLDIVAEVPSEWRGENAFVLSSDVFEHVPPPARRAFFHTFDLLRPGGLLVLTVPFGSAFRTTEHFPDLYDFKIVLLGDKHVLVNRTREGLIQTFEDLVFHGGPGSTLEMRDFARDDVVRLLQESGFVEIRVHDAEYPPFGLLHQHQFGLPITAWRPT